MSRRGMHPSPSSRRTKTQSGASASHRQFPPSLAPYSFSPFALPPPSALPRLLFPLPLTCRPVPPAERPCGQHLQRSAIARSGWRAPGLPLVVVFRRRLLLRQGTTGSKLAGGTRGCPGLLRHLAVRPSAVWRSSRERFVETASPVARNETGRGSSTLSRGMAEELLSWTPLLILPSSGCSDYASPPLPSPSRRQRSAPRRRPRRPRRRKARCPHLLSLSWLSSLSTL